MHGYSGGNGLYFPHLGGEISHWFCIETDIARGGRELWCLTISPGAAMAAQHLIDWGARKFAILSLQANEAENFGPMMPNVAGRLAIVWCANALAVITIVAKGGDCC